MGLKWSDRTSRALQQAVVGRKGGGSCSGREVELGKDVPDVPLHRELANEQLPTPRRMGKRDQNVNGALFGGVLDRRLILE
jgi:hypothetical protein